MELSLGALTYHHFSFKQQSAFKKCIGNCQTILNPIIDLKFKNEHVFAGANSIARPMIGYRHDFPINKYISPTLGSYYQDSSAFRKKDIKLKYTAGDLIPVVGFDFNYKFVGALVTPALSLLYWRF